MFIPCSTTHPSSIHPKEYIVHTDKILNLNKVFQHISHIIHVTAGGTTHYQNNFVIPFSCLMPPPSFPHFTISVSWHFGHCLHCLILVYSFIKNAPPPPLFFSIKKHCTNLTHMFLNFIVFMYVILWLKWIYLNVPTPFFPFKKNNIIWLTIRWKIYWGQMKLGCKLFYWF